MDRQYTILVADRNSHVRGFLGRELTAEGYRVRLVGDGKQVITSIYHSDPLDLIILDPDLPDSEENMLLKQLHNRIPSLPVIIHTFQPEYEWHGILTNNTVFVEKGANSVEHLKRIIAGILEKKKPKQPPAETLGTSI